MRALWLWDIDGTLLRTHGVGRAALDRAFSEVHGVGDAFVGVSFLGRTDLALMAEVGERTGVTVDVPAVQRRYLDWLRRLLAEAGERAELCPGVPAALDAAQLRGTNALLTGNWRLGARLKLGHFGLWDRFGFGAFGCDAQDRNELVPIAVRRAGLLGVEVGPVVVVGDTPADVACARAGGALAVAVASGWVDREALEATGADLVIDDLASGLPALLELVESRL